MYTFTDRGERSLTLRPEGTPGVVRAYIQSGLADRDRVQRLYYFGPFFRYERPQAGRFRQFHQAGVEAFGEEGPQIDASIILLASEFLKALGITGSKLKINSTGCSKCRPTYWQALRDALAPVVNHLCDWCQERYKTNALRILDEKRPKCRELMGELPSILDYLDEPCKKHFITLREYLDFQHLPHEVDPSIVRGLDYYTRTVFEISQPGIGAQDALIGGGRYDNMVEEFGGRPTPAIGWAGGVERILLAAETAKSSMSPFKASVYVAIAQEISRNNIGPRLIASLLNAHIPARGGFVGQDLKSQMKEADRMGCGWAVIVKASDMLNETAGLRDMVTGQQGDSIPMRQLVDKLLEKLNIKDESS
jgi:histidyl-tRNA synthetase